MLSFPKNTEVNKFLPKEKFIDKLDLNAKLKESLKDDIKRFTITNELSPKSINILKGDNVSAIFVMEISLKKKEVDYKLIEAVAKQNPHKILFLLHYENEGQVVVFYGKLYKMNWAVYDNIKLDIVGFNFDEVWDNFVSQIAIVMPDLATDNDATIEAKLAKQEEVKKLERDIARLEKQARNEKQPKKKFEIVGKLDELKKKLEVKNIG